MRGNNNCCKAVVICHGKSEVQICKYIKTNLRIPIHIESRDKGKTSIQITSILDILNNLNYKSAKNLKKHLNDKLELKKDKSQDENFKVFIIMDTDDCSEKEKQSFINKNLFKNHWAQEIIRPIFNIENLEDVLMSIGVLENKNKKSKSKTKQTKKDYPKLFPTANQNKLGDIKTIENIAKQLKLCKKTNLEEFLYFCLDSRATLSTIGSK